MALPNVKVKLGNGNLGRTSASSDGVAGLILTGSAVAGKMELNKAYQISGTRDLIALGITTQTNPLASKEVKAFYAQAGEGAELYLLVVAAATTLTAMCDPADGSPLGKLINAAGGRIRIVGVNKLPAEGYTADITQGIDGDAITAAAKAQETAESCADQIKPFRLFLAAPSFDPDTEKLHKPCEASYNRVAMVLASDDPTTKTAAVGLVLGRAASIEPQQSIGRVKDGAIATILYLTNGESYIEMAGRAESLNDAGYIIPRGYPSKNGAYLNGNPTAAPRTDDYAQVHLGRVIDKAAVIAYDTYISEILDNIVVATNGKLSPGVCISYASMLENALVNGMGTQVSSISVSIDATQNVLSTGKLEINCKIVPLATMEVIQVNLAFDNPALKNV
ncbi:MAG: DUF2586 family protein [Mucinivorans sp.]